MSKAGPRLTTAGVTDWINMKTGTTGSVKHFEIWTAERSYRYKEEALYSHAPQRPGIYQLVTFDTQGQGKTVYMALTQDKSIFEALYEHWRGERRPTVQDLLARYPNLYFSFVVDSNAQGPEDLQDLFWALVQEEKPELLPPDAAKPTGRYAEITVKDKSIL